MSLLIALIPPAVVLVLIGVWIGHMIHDYMGDDDSR
jgi:hypothetical protein